MALEGGILNPTIPLAPFRTAEGLPKEGPDSIQQNLRNLAHLCTATVEDLSAQMGPKIGDALSERIKNAMFITRQLARPDRDHLLYDQEEGLSGMDKADRRKLHESRELLKAHGINIDEVGIDEAFVIRELSEAVKTTLEMLESVDPKAPRNERTVELTAEALADWMDMFIKLHDRFDLSNQQVIGLFKNIFKQEKFRRLIAGNRQESFILGLYGELTGYLHVHDLKGGKGSFSVPRKQSGGDSAVDLVWESEDGPLDGIEYFDVKSDQTVNEPVLVDVMNPDEYAAYMQELQDYLHPSHIAHRTRSASRLQSFGQEAQRRNPAARFYSLRVPSLVKKT